MAAPMTLYQIYREAFDKAKSPTATVEACEKAGLNAVVRHTVHWLSDLAEVAHKSYTEKNADGTDEIKQRPATAPEIAAAFRAITDK